MLTALKKLGTCRVPPSLGLFSLNKPIVPLYSFPKRNFAFQREQDHTEEAQTKFQFEIEKDIQRLTAERVVDLLNPEGLKKQVEEAMLRQQMSPTEKKQEKIRQLQKQLGPNFDKMMNTRYISVIDAFKSRKLRRNVSMSFQDNLDNYKFKDDYDYHVLDKLDEVKALSRLSYVELGNSHVSNKLKYMLKEGEHFSKFESEFTTEDFLAGKPDNYIAVFNLPRDSTIKELYTIFSRYGKIRNINLKRTSLQTPAVLEIAYHSKLEALAAKSAENNRRLKGKNLRVRNAEDSDYEHPKNRTLVIYGIEPTLSFQEVLEKLNSLGNVMNFEIVVKQEVRKQPTREELQKFIDSSNASENGKYKINVKTHRFYMDEGKLEVETKIEDNLLEGKDSYPLYYTEKIADKEFEEIETDIKNIEDSQEMEIARKYFEDSNEKTFESVDMGEFKLNSINPVSKELQNQKNEPSLQYYLKSVEEIKAKSSGDSTMSEQNKIELNNLVEAPYNSNLGYCFVAYSNTDEAKNIMINIAKSEVFAEPIKATLKKDDGHMDWDPEFFFETYGQIRDNDLEAVQKIVDSKNRLKEKEELEQIIEGFKAKTFGDEYERDLLNSLVKKRKIEEKKTPEQWIKHMMKEEKDRKDKVKEEINAIYETRVASSFSKKDRFEINIESEDEDAEYKVGRSYSALTGDKEVANFERVLQNKKIRKQQQLRGSNGESQILAMEELFDKVLGGDLGNDTSRLKNLKKYIEENDPATEFVNRIHEYHEAEESLEEREAVEAEDARRREKLAVKMAEALEKGRARKQKEEEEQEEEYFNPFQVNQASKPKLNVITSNEDADTIVKYNDKLENYKKKVNKIYEADFTDNEIKEDIEQERLELLRGQPTRPYYRETDKDGNVYITEEDEKRFQEEAKPDDLEERIKYEQVQERERQLEELAIYKLIKNNSEDLQPIMDSMLAKGIPVDAYKFEPSEDCKTIEELIEKLTVANPQYNFEKSVDEEGNEIVMKLVRDNIYSTVSGVTTEEQFEKFVEELQEYLVSNGIPQEEVAMHEFKGTYEEQLNILEEQKNAPMTEMDEKILGLLLKKFPRDFVEQMLTGSHLSDRNFEDTVSRLSEKGGLQDRIDSNKALTKDDFVKYSSKLFNVRENSGKYVKSKYDKV